MAQPHSVQSFDVTAYDLFPGAGGSRKVYAIVLAANLPATKIQDLHQGNAVAAGIGQIGPSLCPCFIDGHNQGLVDRLARGVADCNRMAAERSLPQFPRFSVVYKRDLQTGRFELCNSRGEGTRGFCPDQHVPVALRRYESHPRVTATGEVEE